MKTWKESKCRSCGSEELIEVLNLGTMPLANALRAPCERGTERRYPLVVVFCPACSLLQIKDSPPREQVFSDDYPYFSSYSDTVVENAERITSRIIASRQLGPENLVIEVASNDGYLLHNYVNAGVPVLGIDPVPALVHAARRRSVDSLCAFFDDELAGRLRAQGAMADVLHANNVLAHVPDLNAFVRGMSMLLKEDGIAIIEVAYVRELVERCEFDTIYHEHVTYYSLTSLLNLLRRHGLFVNRVEQLPIHGGSLRVFAGPTENPDSSVHNLLRREAELGLSRVEYYTKFGAKADAICESLHELLSEIKASGARIAAYGAAAKGSTLLNYAGINGQLLEYVVDRNPAKQGKLMPGVGLPIYAPSKLLEDRPDYVLLLAWNFADEIMTQQKAYSAQGGEFIVPIPRPLVVRPERMRPSTSAPRIKSLRLPMPFTGEGARA